MLSLTLLSLAVALAMDATAVAMTSGCVSRQVRLRDALFLAALFGLFQAVMPLLGWAAGVQFARFISSWDHWLAFGLLSGIGAKMVWDAWAGDQGAPDGPRADPFRWRSAVLLALATSVDALAAGITLPALGLPISSAVVTIGVTAFVLSLVGVGIGCRFGSRWGGRLDLLGGLVLIGLGTRTLVEHLTQAA